LSVRETWHNAASGLFDLVFPPRCVSCERSGTWLCPDCESRIELIQRPVCPICGQPGDRAGLCHSCRQSPPHIDGIRAVGYLEGPLRVAIHRFKYSNLRPLAAPLGQLLVAYLQRNRLDVEAIVPVPLHSSRLRERGYNQSELLARELGKALGFPVLTESLLRVKSTAPQVGLSAPQRQENVRGAFECRDDRVTGQSILLIDDVCTTGATLESCSLALQQRGARHVWGLVLAREKWYQTAK
jgi:ComF family protein